MRWVVMWYMYKTVQVDTGISLEYVWSLGDLSWRFLNTKFKLSFKRLFSINCFFSYFVQEVKFLFDISSLNNFIDIYRNYTALLQLSWWYITKSILYYLIVSLYSSFDESTSNAPT